VTNYQDNRNRTGYRDNDTSYTGWIIGGVIALALIIGGFMMFNGDNGTTSSASNTNRPAASSPATTGSGTTGSAATPSTAPATGTSR
jgi:hypothetical protein